VLLRAEQARVALELPHTRTHVLSTEPCCCQVGARRVETHARVVQGFEGNPQELTWAVRERDAAAQHGLQQV
jgi:hypothetical protein